MVCVYPGLVWRFRVADASCASADVVINAKTLSRARVRISLLRVSGAPADNVASLSAVPVARRPADDGCNLRRSRLELVGGTAEGLRNVTGEVCACDNLRFRKPLAP